jgi:hypothetical protein
MSLATSESLAVIAARVRATSVAAVARDLGMSRESIARVAAGLPVREGTIALLRDRLAALASSEAL